MMRRLLVYNNSFCVASIGIVLSAALIAPTMIGETASGGEGKSWKERSGKEKADETTSAKRFVLKDALDVNPGGTLTLEADLGSVEILATDTDQVAVEVVRSISEKHAEDAEAILKHHEVTIAKDGDNAVVKSRLKRVDAADVKFDGLGFDASEEVSQAVKNVIRKRLRNIHFRVTVPTEYNVRIKTGGQRITCGDLSGDAHCNTSGGGIKLGNISGSVHATTSGGSLQLSSAGNSVELKTSGGSIRAGDVGGNVVAVTSGGSIEIGRIAGSVRARTSGGSIRISDAQGAVEAVTSGGSVTALISQQPTKDSYIATSGGSIRITLTKELALDLEHQGKGKMSGPFLTGATRDKATAMKLNGGGPKLVTKGNVRFAYRDAK